MNPFRSLFLSLSRMPPMLMLTVILLLAVLVTYLVMNKVNEGERKLAEERARQEQMMNQKVKVVYSTKDIQEGETISPESVQEKEVEQAKAPVDSFSSSSLVVGRTAAYLIQSDTIVSQHALKPPTGDVGFLGKIRPGMRALTFGVDTNSGVAGFIAPGSRVDVICTVGSGADVKASPVLSDVEVIAVGTTYTKQPGQQVANPASSVTVTITPEDSQKLIKAIMAGKLYLTLRNEKDHTPIAVVDVNSLFPKPPKPAPDLASLPPPNLPPPPLPGVPGAGGAVPPPPPPMHEIELWSGSKKEVLSVPQS